MTSLSGFFKTNGTAIVFLVFVIPFAIYMVYLGVQVIGFSHDVYLKSVALNEKAPNKVPICNDCIKFGYTQATTYFLIALGGILLAILLPNLQSVSFGGANITLRALNADVNDLKAQNNSIQEKLVNNQNNVPIAAPPPKDEVDAVERLVKEPQKNYPDDPQKGKWGGFPDNNGRHLRAEVIPGALPNYYKVKLTVTGDPDNPIKGLVKFHLHDTFNDPDPVIAIKNNMAELKLNWVYGAFTVGAEADNGQTRLELDLSELESAPKKFRES
ncbi:MAG: hypothetical protein M3O71_20120 [Bacteroidota bacterium]|nr:hypothetical protein [Bacteroidota bacterium]